MKWGKSRVAYRGEAAAARARATRAGVSSSSSRTTGREFRRTRRASALKRGKRLDETKPGTGLGLAIVSELVGEYGGRLSLGRSGLGGLKVTATLPTVS